MMRVAQISQRLAASAVAILSVFLNVAAPSALAQEAATPPHPGPCEMRALDTTSGDVLRLVQYLYDYSQRLITEIESQTVDGTVTTTRYEYDDAGNLTLEESLQANGALSYRTRYTYGDLTSCITPIQVRGCPTRLESAVGDDGERRLRTIYTYSPAGELVVAMTDPDDPQLPGFLVYDYGYQDGRLIAGAMRVEVEGAPDDPRFDGDARFTYTYDEQGRLVADELRSTFSQFAFDVSRSAYSYDDAGNRLTEETDFDGDGQIDERIVYAYDCWR